MKTIQSKIVLVTISIVVTVCIILGVSGSASNYLTALNVLNDNMQVTVTLAAEYVEKELTNVQQIAREVGCTEALSDPEVPLARKKAILDNKVETYGYLGGNLLDKKGVSLLDGKDYSDRDYFKAAMQGESYISGPLISKLTGEYSIIIAAPLWKNGEADSEVAGVVYFKPDLYILSDIVSSIKVGETGGAYIIDKTGLTIAYPDRERVCKERTVENVEQDPALEKLADIETDMMGGNSGYDSYRYEGITWVQAYTPVNNTDGWSIGVFASQHEYMGNVNFSVILTVILALVFSLIGFLVARASAARISLPIMKCVGRIKTLAEGDLTSEVPVVKTKDETEVLAASTRDLVEELNEVVGDISHVLGELSSGNLNVESDKKYAGDFVPIQTAAQKIVVSLNDAICQISTSAEQVASGSGQVSEGAQALAQSSTEQAGATEELSATMNDIAQQVKITADNARHADEQSKTASEEVESCNRQMQTLISAMSDIRQASDQISHIIKNIEDIAEQTNLLSLNASIEAARAGEAGKGFAVVAGEVGKLASDSSEAARTTTELIAATIQAVEKGTKIVDDTAKSLLNVVEGTESVADTIREISNATKVQTESIGQIMMAIDQISEVVQTNSATSEESSAASEELMAQADVLHTQVGKFRLKSEQGGKGI